MTPKIKKIDSVKFYYTDPRNILNDINSIPELYYLANLTMSTNYRSKISPEVPLSIGYDAYSTLISYYGGENLYIPTREELQSNLLGVMSYYYYNIKGLSWTETMKKLGMTPTKGSRRLLRNRWRAFKDTIEKAEDKIPDISHDKSNPDIESMSAPVFCEDTYIQRDLFNKVIKTICSDLLENNIIDESYVQMIVQRYEE